MEILESAEDYLEAILMLKEKNGVVHSIDIAKHLNFSKASVSVAMKKLRENGYIVMNEDGSLELLEPGIQIAKDVYRKHKTLTNLFIHLGVDPEIAASDACKVEHDLSKETFEKIFAFTKTLESE